MADEQTEDVLYEQRDDGVAVITLNRPKSLNAMGGQLMSLLPKYLLQAQRDASVRAVVLTGAGRAFCAGGDVKGMARRPDNSEASAVPPAGGGAATEGRNNGDSSPSLISAFDDGVAGLRQSQLETSGMLHTMPKPTIGLINGHAVGAGLSLALACDIRIASDKAKFGTAFRNVGLSGDYGGSYYMTNIVGTAKARELYFEARIIDAEEALALGLANRVVPHDDLMEEGLAYAAQLAAGPTRTLARMKENLNLATHVDLQTLMNHEAQNMRLSGMSNDSREAVMAFVEKREPKFAGK
jgi:2-(1,2-epoxy-1,2-dihydrophenyl)acetyl-CoA isomerase